MKTRLEKCVKWQISNKVNVSQCFIDNDHGFAFRNARRMILLIGVCVNLLLVNNFAISFMSFLQSGHSDRLLMS